jgi:hypothetical protein
MNCFPAFMNIPESENVKLLMPALFVVGEITLLISSSLVYFHLGKREDLG